MKEDLVAIEGELDTWEEGGEADEEADGARGEKEKKSLPTVPYSPRIVVDTHHEWNFW